MANTMLCLGENQFRHRKKNEKKGTKREIISKVQKRADRLKFRCENDIGRRNPRGGCWNPSRFCNFARFLTGCFFARETIKQP